MILSEIESICDIVYPADQITQNLCRDRDDHIILECAIEAKSDYIVTGDEDLLILNPYQGIQIINSSSFLEVL
jgi:putative PIN family toxin of toxin-antitoxin system